MTVESIDLATTHAQHLRRQIDDTLCCMIDKITCACCRNQAFAETLSESNADRTCEQQPPLLYDQPSRNSALRLLSRFVYETEQISIRLQLDAPSLCSRGDLNIPLHI